MEPIADARGGLTPSAARTFMLINGGVLSAARSLLQRATDNNELRRRREMTCKEMPARIPHARTFGNNGGNAIDSAQTNAENLMTATIDNERKTQHSAIMKAVYCETQADDGVFIVCG